MNILCFSSWLNLRVFAICPISSRAFNTVLAGSGPPHGVVALVIVGGFLVMLLADHLQGGSGHLRHAGRDSDDEEDIEEGLATGTIHHHKVRVRLVTSALRERTNTSYILGDKGI